MKSDCSCSVVIPVYNSQDSLKALVDQLGKVMPGLCAQYEIILVNDSSRDESWAVIQEICAGNPAVRGFDLMRNYGQHNALLCGIRNTRYELILTMDDDLQHPPEEAYKLFDKLDEGYDVVYGAPLAEQHGFWRDITSKLIKRILYKTMGIEAARNVSAFRVFRAEVAKAFENYQGSFVSIDVLLTWGTTRFTSVPVLHRPRAQGKSNYSFGKLLNHALTLITGFSNIPLKLASFLGFGFMLFGFGVLLYVLISYFIHDSLPGFPFLASIISIFSGVQLFSLGIFGEYLGRMFDRSLNKPTYTIREALSPCAMPQLPQDKQDGSS